MFGSKKGALELSVNTIVVIVIGVTLLTLGLVFVRGIFSQLEDISDATFNRADDLLGGIEEVNDPVTVLPSQIEIEQGKDDVVKLVLANLEDREESLSLTVKVTPASDDNKIDCYLYDESGKSSKTVGPYIVSSGNQKSLAIIVKDKNGGLRTTVCKIKVDGFPNQDGAGEVIVRVIKKD